MIDEESKVVLQGGEIKEQIRLPVEVGLIVKDGEHHLVAFVGGLPVFQYTYPTGAKDRQIRAASDYIKKNLTMSVFNLVSALGREAVELQGYDRRKAVARLWSESLARQVKQDAMRRQKQEISRTEREATTLEPILKSHQWRANLLKRSLAAIAELRVKKKRVSQRAVAAIVYNRRDRYQLDGASSQYWRELSDGFGRPASETFAKLVKVNKRWEQLTTNERSELNCPESLTSPESPSINKRKRKKPRKKS
jgi:hypothetical protein